MAQTSSLMAEKSPSSSVRAAHKEALKPLRGSFTENFKIQNTEIFSVRHFQANFTLKQKVRGRDEGFLALSIETSRKILKFKI